MLPPPPLAPPPPLWSDYSPAVTNLCLCTCRWNKHIWAWDGCGGVEFVDGGAESDNKPSGCWSRRSRVRGGCGDREMREGGQSRRNREKKGWFCSSASGGKLEARIQKIIAAAPESSWFAEEGGGENNNDKKRRKVACNIPPQIL